MSEQWKEFFSFLNDFVFPLVTLAYLELRSIRKDMHSYNVRLVKVETRLNLQSPSIDREG